MKPVAVVTIGIVLAAWMSVGRWLFGLGGWLTWWYAPGIGLTYALLMMWIARRIRITAERGMHTGRATIVSLILSWISAVGFGITVPDIVDGELVSLLSAWVGPGISGEMSIALCNPFGIVAFAIAFFALGFSMADARDPRPEEDENDHGAPMPLHPLAESLPDTAAVSPSASQQASTDDPSEARP